MSPPDLHGADLVSALQRLAERAGVELGIPVAFYPDTAAAANDPAQTATEVVLLRAAQEALANVRRHARVNAVEVRLRRSAAGTRLLVVDDGSGFDASAMRNGYGLAGMRARVDEAGGQVLLDTAPGAGVRLEVVMPWAIRH